jgi:hypothetical protein
MGTVVGLLTWAGKTISRVPMTLRPMRSNPTVSAKAIAAEKGIAARNVEARISAMI